TVLAVGVLDEAQDGCHGAKLAGREMLSHHRIGDRTSEVCLAGAGSASKHQRRSRGRPFLPRPGKCLADAKGYLLALPRSHIVGKRSICEASRDAGALAQPGQLIATHALGFLLLTSLILGPTFRSAS